MSEYVLHREHFHDLVYDGSTRDGDYFWTKFQYFNDEDGRWVYQRYHIPTHRSTFWVIDRYSQAQGTMLLVIQVPVLTHRWKLVPTPTGGSSS